MKSILKKLIYGIEGYNETPEIIITGFNQDPENPKKYFLEIEDNRETPLTAERETLDGEKTTESVEGAEDESN